MTVLNKPTLSLVEEQILILPNFAENFHTKSDSSRVNTIPRTSPRSCSRAVYARLAKHVGSVNTFTNSEQGARQRTVFARRDARRTSCPQAGNVFRYVYNIGLH